MKRFVLLTEKSWHAELFENLSSRKDEDWTLINTKSNFVKDKLDEISPAKIFIPHWSHLIQSDIFESYDCIVFHMTDLPYGRGGSPLQNLIVRGYDDTMISAIKVDHGIDTGGIYMKQRLSLLGSAQEIFLRSALIIEDMIDRIIAEDLKPVSQKGEPTIFKRRKKEDGNLAELDNIDDLYNYIRMLDCEGYPSAFIETDAFVLHFNRASINSDKSISADVRITKK